MDRQFLFHHYFLSEKGYIQYYYYYTLKGFFLHILYETTEWEMSYNISLIYTASVLIQLLVHFDIPCLSFLSKGIS